MEGPQVTPEQKDQLRRAIQILPGGEWEVSTSNSYRRLSARDERNRIYSDGGILRGVVQRDGHPDLSMTEMELNALCTLKNIVADIVRDGQT